MADQFDGDVNLFNTLDGGGISFKNGQPLMDTGLETSVFISQFTNDNWQNDLDIQTPESQNFSTFSDLFTKTLSNQARLEAIETTKQSLQWMIDTNIANRIDVDASIPAPSILEMEITIFKPSRFPESFKFSVNWDQQQIMPASQGDLNACT